MICQIQSSMPGAEGWNPIQAKQGAPVPEETGWLNPLMVLVAAAVLWFLLKGGGNDDDSD